MKWLEHITVLEDGRLCYGKRDLELTCENLLNLAKQSISGSLDIEMANLQREIKIDILLSKETGF